VHLPAEYLSRRGISPSALVERVRKIRGVRLLVVGDLIIDEYVTCEPVGISREEPTVVVTPIDTTRFVGGAGIVAAHAASLGAEVTFVSMAGRDNLSTFAQRSLSALGVKVKIVESEDLRTIVKTRYRSQGKNLLRVNSSVNLDARDEHYTHLSREFESGVNGADAVVYSDFDMGCLTHDVVRQLLGTRGDTRPLTAADSQARLGLGSLRKFSGVDLVTPTESEARSAVRDETSGLAALAHRLRSDLGVPNVLLTLGKEGVLISADQSKSSGQWPTDLLPALNTAPVDVAGAGDCLLVVTTLALATGASIWEASLLGSVAAAVQVGRVGNLPITADEIISRLS
jgi:rfaE bifunctional protein kinase chain/domain